MLIQVFLTTCLVCATAANYTIPRRVSVDSDLDEAARMPDDYTQHQTMILASKLGGSARRLYKALETRKYYNMSYDKEVRLQEALKRVMMALDDILNGLDGSEDQTFAL